MPVTITNSAATQVPAPPLQAAEIPVELYFRVQFESTKKAEDWARTAAEVIKRTRVDLEAEIGRYVIWSHEVRPNEAPLSSIGYVFLSEASLRVLRATGALAVPATKVVCLSELERGLELILGTQADAKAYGSIHHG